VKSYANENANTQGSGPAYGATVNGKAMVYATDDVASQDFFVGGDLIDLDDVPAGGGGGRFPAVPIARLSEIPAVSLGRITLTR
jgi:hypothetical protein